MADFRRWGDGGRESALLHAAGFTRRNTRRAMLAFIREGLAEGEELLELHTVTYRLQMGFLAITDRRSVAGMSWAFLPFVKRRRSVPHRLLASARVRRRAWGTSLDLRSAEDRLRVGNLEDPAAPGLRERVLALAERARSQPAAFPAPDPSRVRAIMDDAPTSQPPSDVPATPPPAPPPSGTADYPVVADATRQEEYHRFLPLVKWLLALPHYIALLFLGIGALVAMLIAFFAVLFTRRYPRGLFDYVVGVIRWAWRVNVYVYLLVDKYPPFTLADDPDYPAKLEIAYPEDGVDRWRAPFAWLLALPYLFVASLLSQVAGIVAFIGIFVIMFTAKLPEGMFKLILIPLRWGIRGGAYAYFLITKYPPFEWE